MRHVLFAMSLLALAPAVAGAQVEQQHDHGERVAGVVRELTALRRALAGGEDLSAGERRRLQLRERRLESQLAALERRMHVEVRTRTLRDMGPAIIEARRAAVAAAAEAGLTAARGFTPEGVRFPGWIGITLDAPCTVEMRGEDVYWRFLEHPEVVSVDPSSPAERAGIRQGDVLLAYNGQDVRREIAMNRLLEPGRVVRVRVRVRRDNEVRDVPVKVAPAREAAVSHWVPGLMASRERMPGEPARRASRSSPGAVTVVVPEPPSPMPIPALPTAPFAVRFNGLAGARVETLSPGLAEAIGVERGVLVIAVAPGVPAQEAGLLDGDVILKANGRDVATVRDLRFVLAKSDEKWVKLDVARKGKVRVVTLKW